jgi:uncharacterized protein (DUF433 family)
MKTLAIRVSDEDHALFVSVAAREDMPLSTLVRRQLRGLAREHGLLVDTPPKAAEAEPSNPRVTWRPIPQGTNVWAYEVHARRSAGESFADIAASYGTDVETIKRRYKFAQEQIDAGIHSPTTPSAPNTPELVYDPVDPDNPTEEEQAINAEIARRKLVDMGLL